ncbi:TPR repeat protein [Luteimonas cucumeris]|uniref:TPR repeat protein n=1 Tax=Luteimonas cucumeris TaxID=985012 RepID=A0A562LAT0_9GAMM|nr:sel1 repeat family protein [Luteimonas cucumeris]TWI04666.1 TPR repeat protein [Luteimonas cucumeris]
MSAASNIDALPALRTAAEDGDPAALHRLAIALAARQAHAEAFVLHKRAAIEGFVPAQLDLSRMLLHGIGCNAEPRTAVYWLRHAEGMGNAEASCQLAFIALGGVAMPRDGRINERVLAAVQGDCPQALLAAAIHFGRKQNQADQQACVQLLDRAASHGAIIAAQLLAERLARGEGCAMQSTAAQRIRRRLASMGVAPLPAIWRPDEAAPATPGARAAPPGTIALEDDLHAAATQTLSQQPWLMQIDALLSADECRLLVACARYDSDADDGTGLHHEDLALRLVQLRLARSARMELAQAEPLRTSHFEHAHAPDVDDPPRSDAHARAAARAGDRTRTIHVFLNADAGFAFAAAGIAVAAKPGRAVIVDGNAIEQVQARLRGRNVPAAERVGQWLATLHFRHRRYRDF